MRLVCAIIYAIILLVVVVLGIGASITLFKEIRNTIKHK